MVLRSTLLEPENVMDLGTTHLFRWDALELERVTDQIRRKVVTGERAMMAHIWLDQGAIVPQHAHEAEQLSWVFSGALKFVIAGETIVVGPGQLLIIPSNVPHEAVALEDTYEMDAFSPIRYDWLDRSDSYFHQAPTRPTGFTNPASAANPAKLMSWSAVPIEAMSESVDRAYVTGERATLADIQLRRGAVIPTHTHESEQLSWVRTGVLELQVEGTAHQVVAGSVLRIPSAIPHRATALEDCRVVDLFSPRREDWLQHADQYLRQARATR